ncbi:MAG: YihY/virulence factor BrkB family protein [Anaerolineales bacterium]|nr:YihY/virulence factor BrkB family protein [Anaerolineales bacterium]
MSVRTVIFLFWDALLGWNARKAPLYAAALAYSTLFSLAPLLIISLFFATLSLNQAAFEARLLEMIENQMGDQAASLAQQILETSIRIEPNNLALVISAGLLLFGASSVFMQLRNALNAMWDVARQHISVQASLLGMVESYLISITVALFVGMAPILLLFASTIVASVPATNRLFHLLDQGWLEQMVQFFSSPVVYFIMFVLLFKLLPQARAPWRAVLPGALLTALLYWIGSSILAWYVQNAAISSFYGAAGSAIVLMLWAYYSAWILLYGARFVKAVADQWHLAIVPHDGMSFVEIVFRMRE